MMNNKVNIYEAFSRLNQRELILFISYNNESSGCIHSANIFRQNKHKGVFSVYIPLRYIESSDKYAYTRLSNKRVIREGYYQNDMFLTHGEMLKEIEKEEYIKYILEICKELSDSKDSLISVISNYKRFIEDAFNGYIFDMY